MRLQTRHRASRIVPKMIATAGVLSLLAGACGGDDDSDAGGTGESTAAPSSEAPGSDDAPGTVAATTVAGGGDGEPTPGGTATYLFYAELGVSFDPVKLIVNTAAILDGTAGYLVYGALVAADPATREVTPILAESLTSDDGTVWTLVLREGLVFSDGTPLDAEAVKFNWERHADEENGSAARGVVATMQSLEVVDSRTLEITLSEPNQQFPRTVGQYSITFIASPAAIEAGTVGEQPIGAGPFVLEEWVRDDHMTFARNDAYWDAPRPYLDEVVVRPILDPTQRINALTTGQGDATMVLSPADAARLQEQGFQLNEMSLNGGVSLLFNFETPLGGDERFRTALRLAIDNEQISEVVHQGTVTDHATTFMSAESPFYDDSLTFAAPDLERAQELIDELAEENGGPVSFALVVGTPTLPMADAMQAQLSALDNLDVQVEVLQTGAHAQKVNVQRDFVVAVGNSFNLDPEPRTHDFLLTGSPRNYTGYSDPEMDAALKAGRVAATLEERIDAYRTVQQLLIDQNAIVLVSRANHHVMVDDDRLHGVTFEEDGVIRWDQAWVSE